MTGFENVVPVLGQALSKRGYTELTPVQEAVLAAGLVDSDLLVSAQTGSGKTVAFGLALAPTLLDGADRFAHAPAPLALVVAPTRELALQVKRELEWLYAMTGAQVASCVGGMDMREERRVLQRGANIVAGTPGRLRDHIERGYFDTTGLKAVVLDEADEMLDLGFRDDLEFILDAAPSSRRTLMFSATVPSSIATLARRYQRDAVRVSTTAEKAQHVDIEYRALTVAPNDRENAIINVLRYFEAKNALVFCATRAAVNRMTSRFNNRGFSVVALSGELSQNERTHALQAMRDGRARVCIATDVAARGLDLPNLELVIHADIPKTRETLLHRSGRTGRAGRKGVCALIVAHNERRRTERLLDSANVTAAWARPPSVDEIVQRDRERILQDPTLNEPLNADEQAFVEALLARHGSEQVAAAFLRLHSAGRSAPEELLDTAPPERKKKHRDDFKGGGGVWFSLSVGHKQNAEARWLLPMLCRVGHVTKHEGGAIKVRSNETLVELAPDCVERFLEAIGPDRIVEETIAVKALKGVPQERSDSRGKPYSNKKRPNTSRNNDARAPSGPKRKYAQKADARATVGSKSKFARKPDAPAREENLPDKASKKPRRKKSHTLKFGARFAPKTASGQTPKSTRKPSPAGTRDRVPETPGSSPLKRKKSPKKAD
jgi:ATP-dependent RNA helicase DeaD